METDFQLHSQIQDLVPCWDPCDAMPLQGDLVEQGCEPPQFLPCLDLGYTHPIPVWGLEELQWWWSHSARWHSWLVPSFLVIAHCCIVMLGS